MGGAHAVVVEGADASKTRVFGSLGAHRSAIMASVRIDVSLNRRPNQCSYEG